MAAGCIFASPPPLRFHPPSSDRNDFMATQQQTAEYRKFNSVEVISGSNQGFFRNLHGRTVRVVKDMLKDAYNINYFAFAIVNGEPAEVAQVLIDGDVVEFI